MLDVPDQDRRAVNDRREVADRRGGTERRNSDRRVQHIAVDVDWRMKRRRSGTERRAGQRRLIADRRGGLAVAF
ncbi:MAG: hypothetical protein KAJ42_13745 [Gemmatimonadetes bacterium]|nr:hypothetical protein [Gemmatimonadota bacterium]